MTQQSAELFKAGPLVLCRSVLPPHLKVPSCLSSSPSLPPETSSQAALPPSGETVLSECRSGSRVSGRVITSFWQQVLTFRAAGRRCRSRGSTVSRRLPLVWAKALSTGEKTFLWSKEKKQAIFILLDSHLRALGCLMTSLSIFTFPV